MPWRSCGSIWKRLGVNKMARKTLDEFKKFIARGNVIDLAVGIVIGSAFTAIVQSLVKDIVNPLLGVVTGNLDFSNYFVALNGQVFETLTKAREAGAPVIAWGSFITAIINFMIITWAVFLLIKAVNKIEDFVEGENDDEKPIKPKPPTVEQLLTEIRDEIRK
jgi:large conductance mechanosensitive channel